MIRTDGRPTVAQRGGHPDDGACPTCKGTGALREWAGANLVTCPDCQGSGKANR